MSRAAHYGGNITSRLGDWHDLEFHFQGQDGEKCLTAIDMQVLRQLGPKTVVSAHLSSFGGTPEHWPANNMSGGTRERLCDRSTASSMRSDDSEITGKSLHRQGIHAQQNEASVLVVHDECHFNRRTCKEVEEPITDDDSDQESGSVLLKYSRKRKARGDLQGFSAHSTSSKKACTQITIYQPAKMMHEAVLSPGIKAVRAADQEDGCRYIRVGERLDDFASGAGQAIDKHSIVVAVVDPAFDHAGGKPQMVKYMAIDTYNVNGIDIGDYDSADQDLILANVDFCPDEYWRIALEEIAGSRGVAANVGDLDYAVIKYSNRTLEGRRPRTDLRPKKTPLRPRHNLAPWTNTTTTKANQEGDISAVITFVNDVANVALGLPRNLQASLEYKEDFSSFKNYILDQRGYHGSLGSMLMDDDSPIDYWADIRIWVLPTSPEKSNREMYEWTETAGMLAKDFLDKSSVKQHGRNLYIEVRIVEDANAEQKNAEWVRRMTKVAAPPPERRQIDTGTQKTSSFTKPQMSLMNHIASPYGNSRATSYLLSYEDVTSAWQKDKEADQDDEEMIEIKAESDCY